MSNIGDGFKNIFLAGIGAMAYTGEKGKEIIDQLVSKGELTLDQGRELNEELQRKAGEATSNIRESALEARMRMMTPEERDEFAAIAAKIAAEQNAQAAEVEAEGLSYEYDGERYGDDHADGLQCICPYYGFHSAPERVGKHYQHGNDYVQDERQMPTHGQQGAYRFRQYYHAWNPLRCSRR